MSVITTATGTYYSERDDYGRTCYVDNRKRGVVVTLPKRTAHVRPAGQNYLVNLHDPQNPGAVTYHATKAEAIAYHGANAATR